MRFDRFNRTGCLLLALALLLTGCDQLERYFPSGSPKEGLLINEVVTSNQLSLQDQVYGSPDWIELYNGSDQSIRLSNYYITDNIAIFLIWSSFNTSLSADRRHHGSPEEHQIAVHQHRHK